MRDRPSIEAAVPVLRTVLKRAERGEDDYLDVGEILQARDEVLARYQGLFSLENLDSLTAEEFRYFLRFKNNRHWAALQRLGPAVTADMPRLREALRILLDESRPILERLNELVPTRGPAFIPRLGKAILTPILLISHPDHYSVWNQVSEAAMKALGLWPEMDRALPFGNRYERVNEVMLETARAVDVDLWTLDALWWRVETLLEEEDEPVDSDGGEDLSPRLSVDEPGVPRFGLERHLHEFLRDNWHNISLGRDWDLYQEDGEPDAGYEYPCDVGRIDLLARHKTEPRWLVVELKRQQSSDHTVGQLLRYMGWVKEHLAEHGDTVQGLVIAHEADELIRYALAAVPNVELQLYEVEFQLRPHMLYPESGAASESLEAGGPRAT